MFNDVIKERLLLQFVMQRFQLEYFRIQSIFHDIVLRLNLIWKNEEVVRPPPLWKELGERTLRWRAHVVESECLCFGVIVLLIIKVNRAYTSNGRLSRPELDIRLGVKEIHSHKLAVVE